MSGIKSYNSKLTLKFLLFCYFWRLCCTGDFFHRSDLSHPDLNAVTHLYCFGIFPHLNHPSHNLDNCFGEGDSGTPSTMQRTLRFVNVFGHQRLQLQK